MRQSPLHQTERLRYAPSSSFLEMEGEVQLALSRAATHRLLGHNEFIYLQDDDAQYLYIVRSGHVRLSYLLEDGSAILFGILPPGESFGELGVFENGTHGDMATSVGTTSIHCIPATTFRTLGARYPALDVALGRTIARRYRSYIALTRNLGLRTLPARLSQCLLRLADGLGSRMVYAAREVPYVGAFVTQTDLGLMARGARGNVNRALKIWEKSGWIAIRDRCILILDRPSLEALAFEDDL
ncbi:MAG: Crp/Fnr family transcriptional regulator [Rhizobiaceae bacterium]|nr:Crp/Fnr family transcriptional regulator [Rhizobiaceae bacterium]